MKRKVPSLDANLREPLAEREQVILAFLGEGLTAEEIAKRLRLARQTIFKYYERVREKLGAATITEARAIAMREGLC